MHVASFHNNQICKQKTSHRILIYSIFLIICLDCQFTVSMVSKIRGIKTSREMICYSLHPNVFFGSLINEKFQSYAHATQRLFL